MVVQRYTGIEVSETVGGVVAHIGVGVARGGEDDGRAVLTVALRDDAEQVIEIPLGQRAVHALAIGLLTATLDLSADGLDTGLLKGTGPVGLDTLTKYVLSSMLNRFELELGGMLEFND